MWAKFSAVGALGGSRYLTTSQGCPCCPPHTFCLHSPAASPNMAPFLRISFNSYELGSLQAADEASQPFCAVRMKEALSTGRAAGWTLPVLQAMAAAGGAGKPGPGGSNGRDCALFS